MSCLNNLGKPIIQESFGVYDGDEIDHLNGVFNLCFGAGKVVGSLVAGSLAKIYGKHFLLYFADFWNIVSCI